MHQEVSRQERCVRFCLTTHGNHPWLARPEAVQRLRTAFRQVARRRPLTWDAAVVLPDAVHGLWRLPRDDPDPRPRWQAAKAHCTRHLRNWPGLPRGRLWQPGVHWWEVEPDRWREALDEIHWEPVRRGLAGRPEGWRYSSFRRCQAAGLYPVGWSGPSGAV
ncbi:MAG: transposase [Halorhodospira halophila]|uniref:REP-associated tyrosine transposase n=1 Tax=Halorhodospira TaxID=85108 RepID=UPI001911E57B|nr:MULTISPECIES: transposase [Halorhodospira]MBK5944553.1 hypothetical protein [Halorhodospira halophila]MCC3751573.1 transposase [Halorhodospira halophila]MCG5527301.1 transposase [Halorhodospira halophila]MCG5532472.1 transposase [Halorhodospira sp. 9621]MCG5538856.1 transposase [Halorhodospira sp. 9622]